MSLPEVVGVLLVMYFLVLLYWINMLSFHVLYMPVFVNFLMSGLFSMNIFLELNK